MLGDDHTPSDASAGAVHRFTRGLVVGGYEGLRAGEAIVAVRGLGLRPSLERVEGYEASLHGFVVSQEPSSGAEVAADSQVFLYIAAPSRTVVEREIASEGEALDGDEDTNEEGLESDEEPVGVWPEAEAGEETKADAVAEVADEYPPVVEEPETAESAAEASDVEESDGQAPVWRGAVPGAVPRRRLGSRRSGRPGIWGSLPFGLRVGLFAVVAVVVLALLVSLASSGQVGRGEFARSPSARTAAPSSRPRGAARGTPGAAAQAPPPIARQPAAPSSTFGRSPRPRVARRPVPSSRVTAGSVVRGAVAGRASAPVGGAGISGAAAEEHADLEFGP